MDLVADNLLKTYGKRTVVDHVSFRVAPGEVVGLLGPNGAGKTTSFYAVVGLVTPDGGRVHLGGDDVTRDPMYVRAKKGIGYLPQEPSVFRKLSVEDNVAAILEMQGTDQIGSRRSTRTVAGRIQPSDRSKKPRRCAVRRRTPPHRDRPCIGLKPQVHLA